jgi:predicted MFS family arabinose efflux permease
MNRVLFLLFLGEALTGLSRTVLGPVYPEIALHRGISSATIGAIFALSPISGLIWSLLIGYIPIKSRRAMLVLRCVLMAISMGMVGISVYFSSVWMVVLSGLSRVIAGVGVTYSDTAGYGLVASYEADNIEKLISYFEMSEGFGLTAGPVFSSFLCSWIGFDWMCYATGLLFLIYLPFLCLLHEPQREDVQSSSSVSVLKLCWHRVTFIQEVLLDCFAFTYVEVCFSALDAFASPHLTAQGLSLEMIGLCYALLAVVYVLGSLLFGQVISPRNLSKTMKIAVVFLAVSIAMTGPPYSIPTLLPIIITGMGATGAACGPLVIPAFPHLLCAVEGLGMSVDDTMKDSLGTLSQAALSVGEILGYWAVGGGVDWIGYGNTVTVIGVVGLAYFVLFAGLYRERKKGIVEYSLE